MTQYSEYGSIPQAVRDLVANKCALLDQYILMQTGQQEYTALIRSPNSKKVKQIRVYRTSNYNTYQVNISDGVWDFTVNNEYYCYSNIGYGSALTLPVVEGVSAYGTVILASALMFAIVFKGVLFPCLKKRR